MAIRGNSVVWGNWREDVRELTGERDLGILECVLLKAKENERYSDVEEGR